MAYSIDFRKKVLSYCERTGSITEASHVFQISRNTIYGWLKLKEKTGELNHQVKGTKPRKVDRDRLKNYLTDNPEDNLKQVHPIFQTVFKTFLKDKEKIVNALQLHYSNAKLEATNNLIKLIKCNAFGFRNFENFKKRIFIALNIKKERTKFVLSRA
ncbi:transposase [Streptococcus pneumoniae]|nr:transposase [Streptococcus pneumoniae]